MKTSAGSAKIVLSVALCVCSNALLARDLGVTGPVYPIAEQDMLAAIDQRLKSLKESGELARIEEDAKARYNAYSERPEGITLPRADKDRTYYVDPSVTVPYDIKDNQGRILYPAGTTVNPLEHTTLSKQLLFFDGDDPIQVEWARSIIERETVRIKLILVNGPIMTLMNDWRTRLYFDQHGELVKQLGIRAVPVIISQEGPRLKVVEHSIIDPK